MEEPCKIYYCYKATNTANGKVYVGFATDPKKRWRQHKADARKGRGYIFHDAIRKHSWDAFNFEVICCGKDKREMLEHVEPALIEQYRSSIPHGYNMHKKVIGASGRSDDRRRPRTPEEKALLSKIGKEIATDPEVRRRLSDQMKAFYARGGKSAMKGKKHSDESKRKMSESTIITEAQREQCRQMSKAQWTDPEKRRNLINRIQNMTTETRQKMSAAKKGEPTWNKGKANTWTAEHRSKTYIVTTPDNKELTVTNLRSFAIENGLSQGTLHMTSTGQRKTHKGYRCRLAT